VIGKMRLQLFERECSLCGPYQPRRHRNAIARAFPFVGIIGRAGDPEWLGRNAAATIAAATVPHHLAQLDSIANANRAPKKIPAMFVIG
jgi:hypothetical protein